MKKLALFVICLWLFSNSVSAKILYIVASEEFRSGFGHNYEDACIKAIRKALDKCYERGYKYYFEKETKEIPEPPIKKICTQQVMCTDKKVGDKKVPYKPVEFIAPKI